jgi:hypothetical protein
MRNESNDTTVGLTVRTGWEPCATFVAEATASPVCAGCGWLAPEHDDAWPLAS